MSARARPCRGCGTMIVWTVSERGRWVPILLTSYDHRDAVFTDDNVPIFEPARGHASHFTHQCEAAKKTTTSAIQVSDPFAAFVLSLPSKLVYHALVRHFHPDVSGETRTMQELTAAWMTSRELRGGR